MAHAVSTAVPDAAARAAIVALADLVEREDGAPPLSDEARVRLASPDVVHLTASDGVQVLGYAQRGEDGCEVVAVADWLDVLLDTAVPRDATVWSHGSRSRLIPALRSRGLVRIRELLQLRRPLGDDPLPSPPELPADVLVRAFEPGRDDAAWLTLNAAAFAAHPEQGRWTVADLRARQAEPWFDPAGFLLAERDAELVGFHWTKVHPDGGGEVYVLGVSPAAQGLGLGAALLVQGLAHLARRGCPYVLLYVDGDNGSAVRLYERAGFTKYDVDVQWRAV